MTSRANLLLKRSDAPWVTLGALITVIGWFVFNRVPSSPAAAPGMPTPLPAGGAVANQSFRHSQLLHLGIKEIPRVIRALPAGSPTSIYKALLSRLAAQDPASALRLLVELNLLLDEPLLLSGGPDSLAVKEPANDIRTDILTVWLGHHPEAAAAWIEKNLGPHQLTPGIASALGRNSLRSALGFMKSLPKDQISNGAWRGLMNGAAENPPNAESQELKELLQNHGQFADNYVLTRLNKHPEDANVIAGLLPDETFNGEAGAALIDTVSKSNPAQAVALNMRWLGHHLNTEAMQDTLRAIADGTYPKTLENFRGLSEDRHTLKLVRDYGNWKISDPAAAVAFLKSVADPVLKEVLTKVSSAPIK